MVTVRFYGDLKQFGTSFKMDVETVPEALRALMTQVKGLREHIEKGHYEVRADGKLLAESSLDTNLNASLHITPVVKGAGKNGGLMQIVVGVVMIAAAFWTGGASMGAWSAMQSAAFAAGVGMVMGGIAQLLTKMPSMDPMKDSEDLKSSSFSNLDNMTAQGAPVPLIYGKMMVGSKVLSQGVRSIYSGSDGDGSGGSGPIQPGKNASVALMEIRKKTKPVANDPKYRFDSTNPKVINRNFVTAFVKKDTTDGK